MIDLTNYLEIQEPTNTRTIMTCSIRLDKKSMLEALMHEQIFINGKYYKVPERTLLECLLNKRFGETRLDLEEVS
jgi:hypothetical protein